MILTPTSMDVRPAKLTRAYAVKSSPPWIGSLKSTLSTDTVTHASKPCVTVSVDKVDFKEPIHGGELLTAYARVNFAGRTSMEVGVKIIAENVLTGVRRHTNSCYVTYVALDEQGVPTQVPPIVPETADEKRRYDRASKRRATRVMDRRFNTGAGE